MPNEMSPGLIATAEEDYKALKPTLEVKYPNQYIALDPISKEYFIDPISAVALKKAISRFPGRNFYVIRIGADSAFTLSWLI